MSCAAAATSTSIAHPSRPPNALRVQQRTGLSDSPHCLEVEPLSEPSTREGGHYLKLSRPHVQCLSCMQCSDPGPGVGLTSPEQRPPRGGGRVAPDLGGRGSRGGGAVLGAGAGEGETRATRSTLRPRRCGAIQPGPAGAAVSGASGGIGSGHSRQEIPYTTQLKAPEGWVSFRHAHLAAPDETTAAWMDPADQRALVRGLEARLREAHRWHACSLSPPRGQRDSHAPDTRQAKKTKTGQGARQRARQQGAAPRPGPGSSHAAPPHAQTPWAHQQHRPHQHPPPPPYNSTLTRQPSQRPAPTHVHAMPGPPFTQSQGTRHHQHQHHAPVPPDPYPPCPNTSATPTKCITTTPQRSRPPGATHPTRHTTPRHTITCTTTTNPYQRTHQRRGTTHNQHTLNTTTTRSSTTYRPHYTGSQYTDHRPPPWTHRGPRTRISSTRA